MSKSKQKKKEDRVDYSDPEILANKLLWPLWRGLSPDFKEKYHRDIWEQFENNIRSSCYTSDLSRFLNKMRGKLDIKLQSQFVEDLNDVLNANQDRAILKRLREDTTLCVLFTRQINEERKKSFKS